MSLKSKIVEKPRKSNFKPFQKIGIASLYVNLFPLDVNGRTDFTQGYSFHMGDIPRLRAGVMKSIEVFDVNNIKNKIGAAILFKKKGVEPKEAKGMKFLPLNDQGNIDWNSDGQLIWFTEIDALLAFAADSIDVYLVEYRPKPETEA